jgi:hypothetical protein
MSNLLGGVELLVHRVEKGSINKGTLIEVFNIDGDFSENEENYRDDTLVLGYKTESERISAEIFNRHKDVEDEKEQISLMVQDVFSVPSFIGNSSYYGKFEYTITTTDNEYIISIAYMV